MKKMYAIFGAGNMAISFVKGMLRKGISPKQILIVIREESERDLGFFDERGITVTTTVEDIVEGSTLLLLVKPQGAGYVLRQLQNCNLQDGQEIISMVSGLFTDKIRRATKHATCSIVIATANTNIACGKGVICATSNSELFYDLGTFFITEEDFILDHVVSVGANNALFAQAVLFNYKATSGKTSLRGWLEGLKVFLLSKEYQEKKPTPTEYVGIRKYLTIVADISGAPPFSFQYVYAKELVWFVMVSTIEALLEKDVLLEQTIEAFIKAVVTKNGCTEKGITKISTVEQLHDKEYLEAEVFIPIVVAATKFPWVVSDSIAALFQTVA